MGRLGFKGTAWDGWGSSSEFFALPSVVVFAVFLVVGAMMPAAVASPAHHAPPPMSNTVSFDGTLTGTGTINEPVGCGLFLNVAQDGTIALADGRSATFHFAYCVKPDPADPSQMLAYDGSFLITTATGTVIGTASGTVQAAQGPNGFNTHLDLLATGGTGAYSAATGTLVFEGAAGLAASTIGGTLAGDLTVAGDHPVNTPARTKDCAHDGWITHTDEHGQPFESRHACHDWVRRHRH